MDKPLSKEEEEQILDKLKKTSPGNKWSEKEIAIIDLAIKNGYTPIQIASTKTIRRSYQAIKSQCAMRREYLEMYDEKGRN